MRNAECGMRNGRNMEEVSISSVEECAGAYPDLKKRTRAFALRVIHLVQSLPKDDVGRVIGRQLLRSGTSVGANYRAAARGKSLADFIAKLGIVEEECDESIYWMELLIESESVKSEKLQSLLTEANELLSITVASIKTARARK